MDIIYYVFAAAIAIAALLSSIAIWAPRDTRVKVLALAVMTLFMPLAYVQLTGLLSRPKPMEFAWLERSVEFAARTHKSTSTVMSLGQCISTITFPGAL